jgi:aryl-phospho-beta-D-glucosidase BglC (GH1 family)
MAGTIHSAELPSSGQRRIEGFDPARDKLDLGGNSVHAFIVVDTAEGVAFMDPWTGKQTLVAGVALGQLTVDSFVPVENDHLRQDLSGALAWEHGIVAAPNTVHARSHEVGRIDRVAFDPATDVVDFRYYGTREQIYMVDGAEGVIIGNYSTGQALVLLGTTTAELSPENFLFHFAQAREDRIWQQLGFDQVPDSRVIGREDIPTVGTNAWPTAAGTGTPPSGVAGTTHAIGWNYGARVVMEFDPAADRLDFRYFRPGEFTVEEVGGSVVISIVGQNQSYTLAGVGLGDLDYNSVIAVEDATYQLWRGLIETARAGEPMLSVADAQVAEGDSGQALLSFTVSLSKPATGVVTVNYATLNGTALAGSDYQAALGTLVFAPGETARTVQVAVTGDTSFEFDERLDLVLSAPSGARLADDRATGTILNDDAAAPGVPPAVSVADLAVAEGDGAHVHFMFAVTLDKASATPVTVEYRTANGSAIAGSDYVAASGTITFAPGETAQQIHVDVIGDREMEPDERFSVTLSNALGATIARGVATGTLLNDDDGMTHGTGDAVAFAVNDNWGAGFVGQMTLRPASALDGWTVAFDAAFDISNIWNAVIVSHVGNHYVIRNAAWNGKVGASGEVSFGFQASPGGAGVVAEGFLVNGRPVGGNGNGNGHEPEPVPPALSAADARVGEGDAGMTFLDFEVTLSQPSASDVTVAYATADGTARAGQDYTASAGTLLFAPGAATRVIRVPVAGDEVVEGNETLTLSLSSPSGATIGDGVATGTIVDDDVATPPVLSVSGTTVVEGTAAPGGAAPGWFSTAGNQIVDEAGSPVKIAGVNWFGFESPNASPHGVWTRSYSEMMDQMKALGFNAIRLPFATDTLRAASASGIDYARNPDLQGLTPLGIMDRVVAYAGGIGLRIILDHHRSSLGAGTSENGLWYDAAHPESQWIDDWRMLAERYAGNPTVIGADLHNEPHAGTWGGGGANDWAAAAERAGNAIGAVNPNWLIFVEGVGTYQGANYWWGGNLMGVRDRPIELDVPGKLVYSAHDYGNSIHPQPWFQAQDFAAGLPAKFDEAWGYIFRENIAPVLIGEFGTRLVDPKDAPWLEALTSYMAGDFDNDGTIDLAPGQEGISWTYWSWNPNSGDTGGILADDWRTVLTDKMAYLEPIQFDLATGGGAASEAIFTVRLSEAAAQQVTVQYRTEPGEAGAADFTAASGTLVFAPGQTARTVRVAVTGDGVAEADERFRLVLSNAQGAVLGTAEAVATIIDDDDEAAPLLPTVSVADASAMEGSAAAPGVLAFAVSLSQPAGGPVSVRYATADGSAMAGQDYQAASGTLTFAAGETSKTVAVALLGDGVFEGEETLSLTLSLPTGASLGDGRATGTIRNDDAAPPAGGDEVVFEVNDNWGAGFVGQMTLNPASALNGWTVEFDASFDISNIWNAEIVSHADSRYVIRNAAWNGKVGADGEASFGFQASPGGAAAVAGGFLLNGRSVGQAAEASPLAASPWVLDEAAVASSIAVAASDAGSFIAAAAMDEAAAAGHGWTTVNDVPDGMLPGVGSVPAGDNVYAIGSPDSPGDLLPGG